ncbi:hypothetical protein Vretimale_12373 [Volvox reticuliferus]|uniref:ferroxidase n=1 Tax=Volvox reticuliferus TaxID=1737510 RepID=A0A8J4GJC3_9CHLO|nr:hypothetical protein Vretifemale_9005 [Volvox reticuliferus]GIM08337.1 hypothetical protein Vretimale_12373 [Volvox reticuliferus]
MAAVLRSRAHTAYRLLPACLQFMNKSDCMRAGWGLPMTMPTNHNRVVVRSFSEELRVLTSTMGEADYHHVADKTLDMMAEKLEVFVEDQEVPDGDIEYSQGVLTVKLGRHGTFVINKQTPNRQIWLSSPVSGPYRFDYVDGRWIYNRDGRDLVQQLEQEIGALLRSELHLE